MSDPSIGFDYMQMRGDAAIATLVATRDRLSSLISYLSGMVETLDATIENFKVVDEQVGLGDTNNTVSKVVQSLRAARPDLKSKTDEEILQMFGLSKT